MLVRGYSPRWVRRSEWKDGVRATKDAADGVPAAAAGFKINAFRFISAVTPPTHQK